VVAPKGVLDEEALNIWTDGSSYPSGPRRGGVGIVFVTVDGDGEEVIDTQELDGYAGATVNEMEILAAVEGLRIAQREDRADGYARILIHTDSMYLRDNYTRAMFEWRKAKWCNRHGRPIENADLWKDLVREIERQSKAGRRVDIRWTKAHKSDPHNKAADKAAKRSANSAGLQAPRHPVGVRRKMTDERTLVGSIKMEGQEIDIRVVEARRLKVQRTNRYRIEVLSADSAYHGKLDFVYWVEYLREGHHYRVRLNSDQRNPQIDECLEELAR
jgi:ribonuclease HI